MHNTHRSPHFNDVMKQPAVVATGCFAFPGLDFKQFMAWVVSPSGLASVAVADWLTDLEV